VLRACVARSRTARHLPASGRDAYGNPQRGEPRDRQAAAMTRLMRARSRAKCRVRRPGRRVRNLTRRRSHRLQHVATRWTTECPEAHEGMFRQDTIVACSLHPRGGSPPTPATSVATPRFRRRVDRSTPDRGEITRPCTPDKGIRRRPAGPFTRFRQGTTTGSMPRPLATRRPQQEPNEIAPQVECPVHGSRGRLTTGY
jgi:hypothetical protein